MTGVVMAGMFAAGFATCLIVVAMVQSGWRKEFEQERQALLEAVRGRVT